MSYKQTDLSSEVKKDDDCYTDSGIVSGHMSCEQFDSEEILDERDPSLSSGSEERKEAAVAADSGLIVDIEGESDALMRLDSGVDVGLTDSFSSLSLASEKRNNLSCDQVPTIAEVPSLNIVDVDQEDKCKEADLPPWQIYFQQDDDGDTQLHIAVIQGLVEAVWALLKMCPHPSLLDIRNDAAQTPLHLAVLTGQAVVVRRLVLAGAKVNSRDCDGNTPLHLATAAGDLACLKSLVSPPSPQERSVVPLHLPAALDQKNYDGETCIHLAAMSRHLEVLKMLVYYGADVNAREGKSGLTVLHIAVQQNDIAIASYLIGECRSVQPGVRNYSGRTAKRIASPRIADLLPGNESDDDYNSEDDDEYDSTDDEMQFGDTGYFNRNMENMAINVA